MTPKRIERGYEAQEEASNHVWTGQHDDNSGQERLVRKCVVKCKSRHFPKMTYFPTTLPSISKVATGGVPKKASHVYLSQLLCSSDFTQICHLFHEDLLYRTKTCGCGPVLCMACMSPAVDSELYSKNT